MISLVELTNISQLTIVTEGKRTTLGHLPLVNQRVRLWHRFHARDASEGNAQRVESKGKWKHGNSETSSHIKAFNVRDTKEKRLHNFLMGGEGWRDKENRERQREREREFLTLKDISLALPSTIWQSSPP